MNSWPGSRRLPRDAGANACVSDLVYADDIGYRDMKGTFEAVNRHTTAVDLRINVSTTTVLSALVSGEQQQTVLLDGEPLEHYDKFK